MRKVEAQLAEASGDEFAAIRKSLSTGVTAVEEAVEYVVATYGKDIKAASVGSVPFLEAPRHRCRWLADGPCRAGFRPSPVRRQRRCVVLQDQDHHGARFYADHVLSQAPGLAYTVVNGAGALDLAEDQF